MATTPPHQIASSPLMPPTPLHGPTYDDESPRIRSSARLRQKRALDTSLELDEHESYRASKSARTPTSPRQSIHTSTTALQSPGRTPKRKITQRVQVFSPQSPDIHQSHAESSTHRHSHLQPHFAASAISSEAMLPTPVKTPKKKAISKTNLTGRALFQDAIPDAAAPSPRKSRKTKRFNGFSLESFRAAEAGDRAQIQIYTDSRDQVPELDSSEENPFIEEGRAETSAKKVHGTTKRRKMSGTRRVDPQVEEAIWDDNGMVYVFRGKKVYRRFDDAGEEEEEIDPEDLGLLEGSLGTGRTRAFRTLTRKSIKPMRLFQTDEQKRVREMEKEEEATTDIDDTVDAHESESAEAAPQSSLNVHTHHTTAPPQTDGAPAEGSGGKKKKKKKSPFDSWPRYKSASMPSARATRGRKRAAPDDSTIEAIHV